MTLDQFIQENRGELVTCIGRALGHVPRQASCSCPKSGTDHYHQSPTLNDEEIKDWILNDEGLYRWAQSARVEYECGEEI